jgi:hypothetical protein
MEMFIHPGFSTSQGTYRYSIYMADTLKSFFQEHLPGSFFAQTKATCPGENFPPWFEDDEDQETETAHEYYAELSELFPLYLERCETGWSIAHFLGHIRKSFSQIAGAASLFIIAGALYLSTFLIRMGTESH